MSIVPNICYTLMCVMNVSPLAGVSFIEKEKIMGGVFGVASKSSCTMDLFFGIDYHSHLGTRRGGMAVYGPNGFNRSIHNIENSPFRTKFERDVEELEGNLGIGCISDMEPQPLLIQSHLGSFAITTVGKINNEEELVREAYANGHIHFMEMSGGRINATELVAALINQKDSLVEGLQYVHEKIDGSMTVLLLAPEASTPPGTGWAAPRCSSEKRGGLLCLLRELRIYQPGLQ